MRVPDLVPAARNGRRAACVALAVASTVAAVHAALTAFNVWDVAQGLQRADPVALVEAEWTLRVASFGFTLFAASGLLVSGALLGIRREGRAALFAVGLFVVGTRVALTVPAPGGGVLLDAEPWGVLAWHLLAATCILALTVAAGSRHGTGLALSGYAAATVTAVVGYLWVHAQRGAALQGRWSLDMHASLSALPSVGLAAAYALYASALLLIVADDLRAERRAVAPGTRLRRPA